MTTAHRPTFFQALGGDDQGGNKMMAPTTVKRDRDMPQELTMKLRAQAVQPKTRAALLEELEEREAGKDGAAPSRSAPAGGSRSATGTGSPAIIPSLPVVECENPFPEDADQDFGGNDDKDSQKEDADSDGEEDSEDSDMEDLQRELAKIRQEKEDERLRKEVEAAKETEEERKQHIGKANPLINENQSLKRKWDEDTVFRNQARTEPQKKRRFVNDNLRTEFHRRFINKYIKS